MVTKSRTRRKPSKPRQVLPLHHRIYVVLRQRLTDGAYALQSSLPGEHQLALDFKASRVTIRRVLDQLDREKLIVRRHGVGTFPLPAAKPSAAAAQMSYYDYIAAAGHDYHDVVLEFERIPTPPFLAQIDARFAPEVLKVVRVAHQNRVPRHILRTYVPGDIAQHLSRRGIGNKTVLEVLKKHGVEAQESELQISATVADTFEAQHLKVPVGAPLVHATRISRLAGGRAIEHHQMQSVAELFAYRFFFDDRAGAVRLPGTSGLS